MTNSLHVTIIGPLAPPAGGMAAQTRQLHELLEQEGVAVEIVQTNFAYRPAIVEHLRGIRALFRLIPYLGRLWKAAGRSTVFHVMANSGWAWHLFAVPAIWIGKARGIRVVVNYRGGCANEFFSRSIGIAHRTLRMADAIAVPSTYLQRVFANFGIDVEVIPNVVDAVRFSPPFANDARRPTRTPHVVITRNLERIYDIATAVKAFAKFQAMQPESKLTIAGTGPEEARLRRLVGELSLSRAVTFCGELSRDAVADLYRNASLAINSSIADNTPNSLLEAMACGVPIVSTDVGGIPFLVQDRITAILVPPEDPEAMAQAMQVVIGDSLLAERLIENGLRLARSYAWANVRPLWMRAYHALSEEREPSSLPDDARLLKRGYGASGRRVRGSGQVR